MIGGAILLSLTQGPPLPQQEGKAQKADPFAELKIGVAAQLSDPGSATFRALSEKSPGTVYCGEVNAKNRMGGYVGYKKFFAVKNAVKKVSGDWLVDIDGPMANHMCK